jgi:hypothetical protein
VNLRFFLFFLTTFALLATLGRYLRRRAVASWGLGPRAGRAIDVVVFGALILTAAARVLERRVPAAVLSPIATAGFAVALAVGISGVLLALGDLVAFGVRRAARLRRAPAPPVVATDPPVAAPEPAPPVARRDFLAQVVAGSAIAVGGGSAGYGTLFGRHAFALEEVPVKIPGLARALDGFTLVQLSDVHLGLFIGDAEIRAAEDLVRRARPDLIVLTGDLLDHDARDADLLGRMVARLMPLSRGGVVAIPGNHDYYAGIEEFSATLARAGARLLRNEGMMVGGAGGFALLGVDDVWGPRVDKRAPGPDLQAALATLPAAADHPRVLLCHNPVTVPKHAGKVALQLSGHTHGGQVNVGVRLADVVLGHPYIAGRYEREGTTIYVNRGFGTAGPPARVGSPPEVTRVVLVAG